MDIVKLTRHSPQELLDRLRQVPLLNQPDILVYARALISLENIHTDNLVPAQNYIWLAELRKVQELRWSLAEQGVDLFRLDGFVTYTVRGADGAEENYDVYPPVVEESLEADGSLALIINDGMHRLYLARLERVVPQVIYIRGVPKEYPYYAFPRPEGWAGIDLLPDNPDPRTYLKKCHRRRENKRLYRDFQAVFANVGRSRSRLLTPR
uniref:ParB-like catalytic effector domain-containing protein n=1 Tax=Desulfobacca acetoxidans TaxID=60893 RepID=A0A7C3V1T1_9BACT